MKRLWVAIIAGSCLVSFAAIADDTRNFGGTAKSEANACIVAQNNANHWLNQNIAQIHAAHKDVSQGDCKCVGDDQRGWACTVSVQIR